MTAIIQALAPLVFAWAGVLAVQVLAGEIMRASDRRSAIRKALRSMDAMSDNQIAGEIDHLECISPRPGSFDARHLSCAERELDNRI